MQQNFVAEKPLGYFQIAAGGVDTAKLLSTAIGQAIPVGTVLVLITPEAQAIRWEDDGSAPTTTKGYPLAVGQELRYTARAAAQLQLIAQTAGAIVNVVFYG